jgi:hypothetical protein
MSSSRLAGDPIAHLDEASRITSMSLELLPLDFIVQWRRCSLTADYLAAHLSYHFLQRDTAREVLSGGLNELIENLAKFSDDKRHPVTITVSHYGEVLRVETVNVATKERAGALAERLDRMATTDPELLFLEQLEHTAVNDAQASGLGLITIKKDYGARMSAVISDNGERCEITFILDFDVEAIESA